MAQARGRVPAGEVILDFSEVKPFEPLDSSRKYLARITKLDLGSAKSSGAPVSNLELTIENPEKVNTEIWDMEAKPEPHFVRLSESQQTAKGRKLFRTFTLEPQALPFLHGFLRAVNPEVELVPKGRDGKPQPFRYRPDECVGLQVVVSIENQPYEEQVRSRPRNFYPASSFQE